MTMTKHIALFATCLLLATCSRRLYPIRIPQQEYTGTELRIDGYYKSELIPESTGSSVGLTVFYEDGTCIHNISSEKLTESSIEEGLLRNAEFINKLTTIPGGIGLYQISEDSLTFEIWSAGSVAISTLTAYCTILNDTTFVLSYMMNNRLNSPTSLSDVTFHFVPYSPKPDNTTIFLPQEPENLRRRRVSRVRRENR